MVKKGEIFGNLQVVDFSWRRSKKSHWKIVRVRCNLCGKEFTRTENALHNRTARCTCEGGYNQY